MAKLGKVPTKRRGRAPKDKSIGKFEAMLDHENGFVLADNLGMTVASMTAMRATMRGSNVQVKVAKNRLLRIALQRKGVDAATIGKLLSGPTVLITSKEDPVAPAKLLTEAAKASEGKLAVKGGFFEGKVLNPAEVEALGNMPSKEELLSRLCGSLQGPPQKLAVALNQTVAKIAYAVDAYRRKLEGGDAA